MKILFVDDHDLLRDGLKPFLEDLAHDVEVIEAGSVERAIDAGLRAGGLDLILLDLNMPGLSGVDGVRAVREKFQGVPLVLLTAEGNPDVIRQVIDADINGFIPKTMRGAALVSVLRLVLMGERYLPATLLQEIASRPADGSGGGGGEGAFCGTALASLTPREREVLSLVVEGGTNKVIARHLELQEITVKMHLTSIYRKIGAANRSQAVRIAIGAGMGGN